jgi:hypothetical protein
VRGREELQQLLRGEMLEAPLQYDGHAGSLAA